MRSYLFLAAIAAITSPALAQAPTPAPTPVPARDADPVVCHDNEITGSRLGVEHSCMRRSQWVQMQRETRSTVERVQTFGAQGG